MLTHLAEVELSNPLRTPAISIYLPIRARPPSSTILPIPPLSVGTFWGKLDTNTTRSNVVPISFRLLPSTSSMDKPAGSSSMTGQVKPDLWSPISPPEHMTCSVALVTRMTTNR